MTEHVPETMDQYERRLGPELHALSATALRPVDAVALAHDVAASNSHRSLGTLVAPSTMAFTPLVRWRLAPPIVALATTGILGVVVVLSWLAGSTGPAPRTNAGEIVFVSASYSCADRPCMLAPTSDRIPGLRAENPVVMTVSADGDEPMQVVAVPGARHRPTGWRVVDPRSNWLAGPAVRWSPDGSRLAFRLFNDAPGIYVMDRDGNGLARVVELPLDHDTGMGEAGLAWSPDGTRIAYTYPYGGMQSPIHVVELADGHVTDLQVLATRALAWSPDGSRIAFVQSDARNAVTENVSGLVVVDADGTGETPLAGTFIPDYHVGAIAWSPDGSRIAFDLSGDSRSTARGRPDRAGLYTIAPDGTSLSRLTQPDLEDGGERGGCCVHVGGRGQLAWSPDGSQVAAVAQMVGSGIIVADADGSGLNRFGPPSAYALDWSPDGSELVYAAGPTWTAKYDSRSVPEVSTDEWSSIYVISADGTGGRWLADGEFPDWSSASGA